MKRGKAKVSWDDVCLPKIEGGLGIRKLDNFNVALMSTHVWKLITHKESLWVKWIHAYKLNNRSFWDVKLASNVSWGWRKLLQIRNVLWPHFWHVIGNGQNTSIWFDNWNTHCPLINHVSYRAIASAGFRIHAKVSDVISDGEWMWPIAWFNRFLNLFQLIVPNINEDQVDKIFWKSHDGILKDFSTLEVWHTIRQRGNEKEWSHLVWSSYGIPRHAIHLWLVLRRRLKTQDRLKQWDVGKDVDISLLTCPLCKTQKDSREFVFRMLILV